MRGLIIYDSKYGATEQYALWISDESGFVVAHYRDVTNEQIASAKLIIVGAPVYAGRLRIKRWLHEHTAEFSRKRMLFFIVGGTDPGKPTELEKIIFTNIPQALRKPHNVFYLRGRLSVRKLRFGDRLMLTMGALLQKDPEERKKMKQDFDEVSLSNLGQIFEAINNSIHDKNQHHEEEYGSV